ncbi:MAG: DUF5687 family protein [Rubricoccaceae bacterium]
MFGTLLRLQLLAFRRAPHFGGRLVLAILKALGLTYAVVGAALLGFLIPDTLSVWAPQVSAMEVVERALLPMLGLLTVMRVMFQDVPTRGMEAFLLLPVNRQRVARTVLWRSSLSVLNAVPLAFVIPFAARTIRLNEGAGAALMVVTGSVGLVALSHVALVIYKTRLGERPVQTVALLGGALAVISGLDLALGGLIPQFRQPGGWMWVAAVSVPVLALSVTAYRGLVEALYLDLAVRPVWPWSRPRREQEAGFKQPGFRTFIELDLRQLARTRYPRGILLNAAFLGLVMSVVGLVGNAGESTALLMVFAVATLAISAGQFTLPFVSNHYDRLLTLPEALPAFVRAKLVMLIGSVLALGLLQLVLALALAPSAWQTHPLSVGAAVLFGAGVLVPMSILASTIAPKPIDMRDRAMMNTRVQSIPAQVVVGLTSFVAVGLVLALGPRVGLAAIAVVGGMGLAALPMWERLIVSRLIHQRHGIAARFRATL